MGGIKVILSGPPQSGKSCLREGLKAAIRGIPGAPYPYIITGCPDGEGAWFQGTAAKSPSLARECKTAYKAKFTPEFVARISSSVAKCELTLTLVDIGGIPSEENMAICASATHIVILSNSPDRIHEWQDFARNLGLVVIAEIISDYNGTQDTVDTSDSVLRGSVHHLERGEDNSSRPMVQALARHIVALARNEE